MKFKQLLLRIFFIVEIVVFGWAYLFGEHGVEQIDALRRDCSIAAKEAAVVEDDVQKLKSEIEHWESNSFLREKIAREQLQMVRPGEQVYYIQD